MKPRPCSILCLLIAMSLSPTALSHAQDTCSVSGDVSVAGDNVIYIYLLDAERFREYRTALPSSPFEIVIRPDPAMIEKGTVPFRFEQIPKGEYVIFAYKDADGNGKPEFRTWGAPDEPACFHRKSESTLPGWQEQKFAVDGDVSEIHLFR